jgi:chemotaxis protein methyltransferase WspC
MTLREAGLAPDRFRVDAFDLSRRALEAARLAAYGERAVRRVPPRLLRHYFLAGEGTWTVSQDARRGVHFSRGNVIDPGVLRDEAPFDVVFCRNVLIYLDDRARRRLMDTIARALRDDGVLITGHAETATVVAPLFVSAGVPRTFAYVKHRPEGVAVLRSMAHAKSAEERVAETIARSAPGAASAEPSTLRKRRAAHDGTPTAPIGPGDADLEQARRLADAGRLVEAIAAALRWVAAHPTSVEGHFLVGVAASAAGRFDAAEQALRRVLYLDPGHDAALAHLADLRERAGARAEAARLRRRARRTTSEGARR